MNNFDMILERIGTFGRYQLFIYLMCSFATIPAGFQNVLNAYLQAIPEHWCCVPEIANLSVDAQESLTSTYGDNGTVNPAEPTCVIRDLDYATAYVNYLQNETVVSDGSSIECSQWSYDYSVYGTTAVTYWDLVCSKASYPAIAQSIYMVGFLLGGFVFGYVSDRYGRRRAMCSGLAGSVFFGCVSAFMPEFWSHILVRMVVGLFTAGACTVAFVTEMEIIGIHKRQAPGLSAQIFFAIGYMLLALVAYLTRSFRWTNFISSIFPIAMLSFWFILPESPRWQMANGQIAEAKQELTRVAKMNKVDVDVDELVEEYMNLDKKDPSIIQKRYTIIDLVRTPNMRRKSLNMFFNWFVTSMVYYGLTMGATELAGDPYLNMFVSGLCECAAMFVLMATLDRFGRRLCLGLILIVGGVACIVCGLLPDEYSTTMTVLSMIGKFGVAGSFGIIYVFTAELFPTVVRTTAVGAGSMSARVGGFLAPFVAQLSSIWEPLPTLIFGVLAVSAGLLSFLFPETLGQKLPDSMEDGERFGQKTSSCECYPCKKTLASSAERGNVDI